MTRWWRTLARSIAAIGWRATACYALDRALRRLRLGTVHRYAFLVQPLAALAMPRDYAVHALTSPAQCQALLKLEREVAAYRLAQGGRCIAAFHKEEAVAALWFVAGGYEEDEVRARYEPWPAGAAAWDFGVWVAPRHRMSRAFAAVWAGASAAMQAMGARWSLSRISVFNEASVRAHRRLGARVIGHATFVRLGEVQLALASVPPYAHLSRHRRQRPVYRLSAVASTVDKGGEAAP
ncbi:MAG: hypothetical protein ACOY99_07635 [Pseudomonadota bacterium]